MTSSNGEWDSDGGESYVPANFDLDGMLGVPCSSDSCADMVAAPTSPWDYPLSAAEKQERVLLLFDKEASLASRQLHRRERHIADLHAQVAALHGDRACRRRERRSLRREAAFLRSENGRLHERVGELLLQLQQLQQQPSTLQGSSAQLDGRTCGIKHAALPPSRVQLSAAMSPSSGAAARPWTPRLSAPCLGRLPRSGSAPFLSEVRGSAGAGTC
mmetsp:Transcript_87985/g.278184  ORF Transcript_87985/g.278184 Transcript_87985/m.278184 type:complete len:216 (+) Transcript_87985:88-735(+)